MLAAVGNEAEKSAARALVLPILIQMSRKLFDAASQNSNLHFRTPCVRVVAGRLLNFSLLLSLCQHGAHDSTFKGVEQGLTSGYYPGNENRRDGGEGQFF